MFQCLITFLNEIVSFSIASMASSNVSLVLVQKMVGHSPCFDLANLVIHFTSYETHSTPLSTSPWPLLPTCWWCVIWPYKRYKLKFFIFCPALKKVWQVRVCLKCMSLISRKKLSMHRIVQSHPKLSYGLLFLCKR
jgi:hypothetical protein